MNKKISILLVDDHQVLRKGLKEILKNKLHIEEINEADNANQGYELYIKYMPDILITDLSLSDVGGLELINKIRRRNPHAKIIVYSMHEEHFYAVQALSAGALGYVLKSSPPENLFQAITHALNGKPFMCSEIAQKVAIHSLTGELSSMETLTSREFEVFRLIAKGLSVNDIANLLSISHKTVATYQTRLKRKLNIQNPIDLVKIAMQQGVLN
ncbi:response regulator [Methylophaga nitratireducenticrescens]|uniref:Two component transcriptional regulator n=1 Tax=Methylophaga nitratireducenticrescens TaxID=754476 RepID=I1XJP6_METNJ|nr:response regulator transcription factor [Methylophaga nitratireducenticrescens]AFI84615.1 DNA-binding response regulator [Methylophaga nitratireducenticrescens]AUZ84629.1 DNA-binding response regulator [Methylophaga nitratireducenticrescens]